MEKAPGWCFFAGNFLPSIWNPWEVLGEIVSIFYEIINFLQKTLKERKENTDIGLAREKDSVTR